MAILAWLVFGLVAGAVAKWIVPGRDPGGILVTLVLGVSGALAGGFVATSLGIGSVEGFDLRSFAIAVAGAVFLLVVYRLVDRR
jgi:uncharacterized membrane protein YeaQ/YmgE (transglycosylase-associated protein family)